MATKKKTVLESIAQAKGDLLDLTQDITDPQDKSFLRPALRSHLLRLKHDPELVDSLLNDFFAGRLGLL